MGCGAGKSRQELQHVNRQVEDLRLKLQKSEEETRELQRKLQQVGQTSSQHANVATATTQVAATGVQVSLPAKESGEDAEESSPAQTIIEHSQPTLPGVPLLPGAVNCEEVLDSNTCSEEISGSGCGSSGQDFMRIDVGPQESNLPIRARSTDSADNGASDDRTPQSLTKESARNNSCKASESEASTCACPVDTTRCTQCLSPFESSALFLDASDMNQYCEQCWTSYYGQAPERCEVQPLIKVEIAETWHEERLAQLWAEQTLPGWPPPPAALVPAIDPDGDQQAWSSVSVRVRRNVVGPHAREQHNVERPILGEVLAGRYRLGTIVGEGHFTKAFLAEDLASGDGVCVKRHRNLSIEALADLMVLGQRLREVDAAGACFPVLIDAFFDIVGFTVESLLDGHNCLSLAHNTPTFFADLQNLHHVARGALSGLVLLEQAGIVHNDMKPDNLMWMDPPRQQQVVTCNNPSTCRCPSVRIVDFGCARLDQREEPGRNWSLAEGGAGHLGKWSPEMALRLPITHRADIWGIAITICELHCGRSVWRNEADSVEVVLAQGLGLCGLPDGLPRSLLRRSPLDIRQLYTPGPRYLPLRRNAEGRLDALKPAHFGLEQVLGENWRDAGKGDLGDFLQAALAIDPAFRPSARQLVESAEFVQHKCKCDHPMVIVEQQQQQQQTEEDLEAGQMNLPGGSEQQHG